MSIFVDIHHPIRRSETSASFNIKLKIVVVVVNKPFLYTLYPNGLLVAEESA